MGKVMVLCLGLAVAFGSDKVREPLTNSDVVNLVKAGFGEGVVLQALQNNDGQFDLSPEALGKLRQAGVGESVISAMLATAKGQTPHLRLLDPGVYFKRLDAYAEVKAEVVTWRGTSSVTNTDGVPLTKLALVGRVENRTSWLPLSGPAELLIVCEPGVSASEYQLLRAEMKEEWREFRAEAALRGHTLLGFAGADRDQMNVEVDNSFDLGTRLILTALRKGEYALVPPGVIVGGKLMPVSRVYTFSIE